MPIGVVIVDDQPAARRAIRQVIAATPGFELRGEAESAGDAVALVGSTSADLALVEVRIRGTRGPEIARSLREAHPTLVVVLLSVDDPLNLPAGIGSSGADDFVRKQHVRPALLRHLWAVHGNSGALAPERPARLR